MPRDFARRGFAFVVSFACLLSVAQVRAAVILPDLPAGSQYQLVFVTAHTHHATSADIEDYNAFVTAEALQSDSLPETNWHAIVSTLAADARDNAPTYDLPIYNTAGELVTIGSGLWETTDDVTLLASIAYTQTGAFNWTKYVMTGSEQDGTRDAYNYARDDTGSGSSVTFGHSYSLDRTWIRWGHIGWGTTPSNLYVYALSDPITVVPEPSALIIWSLLGCLAMTLRWPRRGRRKGKRTAQV